MLIVFAILPLSGCKQQSSTQEFFEPGKTKEALLLEGAQLRLDLFRFADVYTSEVVSTANEIARSTEDSKVREFALTWKIRVASGLHAVTLDPDPRVAMVNTWMVTVQHRMFFTTVDAGKDVFGVQQKKAVQVALKMENDIEDIIRQYIPEEIFDKAESNIEELAIEYPIVMLTGTGSLQIGDVSQTARESGLGDILSLPLAPLTGLQGVGTTSDAVDRIGVILAIISKIFEDMPRHVRWQAEALMLELENSKSIEDVRKALVRIDEHTVGLRADVTRATDFVESIPDELSEQQVELFEHVAKERMAISKEVDEKIDRIDQKLDKQRETLQKFFSEQRNILLEATELRMHNVVRNIFVKSLILFAIIISVIILLRFLPKRKTDTTK
ncbi:MAG: hypothetical protein ACYTFM_05545 [Planctomycetota bacterium]|jgi:hypothetical protein